MKTCIFGGTFDPPHIGHLLIAQTIIESENFERLIFVPANISPASRLLKIPTKPPRGSRLRVISEIAEKYSLTAKQVDNLWQEYRRFERS